MQRAEVRAPFTEGVASNENDWFYGPILPGKSADFGRFAMEISGPRKQEMDASRRALGQTRETTWIQPTPMGDMLVVYLEGQDSIRANRQFAASQSSFDRWFKQEAQTFTGIDFNQPLPDGFVEVLYESPAVAHMPSLAVAIPILPGKTESFRQWAKELAGPRLGEYQDFFRRAGVAKANLYLQHTPQVEFAIQYSEAENPAGAYQYFAASDHPFDRWTRDQLALIHGVDFSQPPPGLPELGFDWQA